MATISMRQMLEAGVHFGHQTRYWSPKMRPYIYGERNKIHIINLEHTLALFGDAMNFLGQMAANNGTVLFVGTKRAAGKLVKEAAESCGSPYVNHRWLGGMLTNFKTVKNSIQRLKDLEAELAETKTGRLSKKELLGLERERAKLERSLGGIKNMSGLPDVVFVIDVKQEYIAVAEANKLGVPVVAVVDTNCNPDGIDYVIPGNDDAIRAIKLYVEQAAEAINEGRKVAASRAPIVSDEEYVEVDDEGQAVSAKTTAKVVKKKAKVAQAAAKPAAKKVKTETASAEEAPPKQAEVEPVPVAAPESDATAEDEGDLTQLNGVGKVIANKLNDHGITLKQIAAWTDEDVHRVDEQLDLKGRIAREDWVAQAKALLG